MVRAAVLLTVALSATAAHGAAKHHVCGASESSAPCPVARVRMCTADGALAACVCPPGLRDDKGTCVEDTAKVVVACVVPNATIGKLLGVHLELGTLEVPRLTNVELSDAQTSVAINTATATDAQLLRAADAWESIEGAAAYAANEAKGLKAKSKLAARDQAVDRGIATRRAFVERFPAHARADEQRVALARALLRRAAYVAVGTTVAPDRAAARALLERVVENAVGTRPSRDAAFILGEQAVRDLDWKLVIAHNERVLKWASAKANADDHALLAAAHARLAHAWLETADLARAKHALDDAITVGLSCAPRAECVVAASAARRALAATWAASSSPARALVPLLKKGTMPRHDRVRPLHELAELYDNGSGADCASPAEEARAWAQVL